MVREGAGGGSTYRIAAWLFLRWLGLVYLIAFWSLGLQVVGLVGHDGILPVASYLARVREAVPGIERLHLLPTLAWVSASDTVLRGLSVTGVGCSLLLVAGIAPAIVLPVVWILYLSLCVAGGEFLAFQWDSLLLETGLIAAFAAPWTWRHRLRDGHDLPTAGRLLLLWLLVRLMLGSGLIKLSSGDPTWRHLTALSYHFWTQPLPTPLAWYAARLPQGLVSAATASTLVIEFVAPLAVAAPRVLRGVACGLLVGLQAIIALTGNYAFFNLLSMALTLPLLDDRLLERAVPSRRRADWLELGARAGGPMRQHVRRRLVQAFAVVTIPVSVVAFGRSAGIDLSRAPVVGPLERILAPFRSVNTYGLFAVMTTSRPEIVVEGSDDRASWKTYEFKYKPTDVDRRPPWVAPFQPRLDWQMWFAALGPYQRSPWFRDFCRRLLEASPDVLALLADDPFDGRPPRYVRGVLYQYRFSSPALGRESGAWWTRERVGIFSPELSLDSPGMRR